MATFDPPFAEDGPRRAPTLAEQSEGFPFGVADRSLFNQKFNGLESQIREVIVQSGIADPGTKAALHDAIVAVIENQTGSGADDSYVTLATARARLPIYPEVLTTTGTVGVTSGNGQIGIPANVDILHRGIASQTTVAESIATTASRTYHLRWTPGGGFALRDLADSGYNPSNQPEASSSFDTTYDDMLVARVTTSSTNAVTVVNLSNKAVLKRRGAVQVDPIRKQGLNEANGDVQIAWNLARTPNQFSFTPISLFVSGNADDDWKIFPFGGSINSSLPDYPLTRYGSSFGLMRDFMTSGNLAYNVEA